MNIKKVLAAMKPLWIGPFTILSENYNRNNYSLDLSSDPSLNLIYNTFHVGKINPYMNDKSILFTECQLEKSGPILQDRCEVEKVIANRKTPRPDIPQYKVPWLEYSLKDDQCSNPKDISSKVVCILVVTPASIGAVMLQPICRLGGNLRQPQ